MNLLVVAPEYPDRFKAKYQFVKELVTALARSGHSCYVIAPYSVTKNRRFYPYLVTEEEGVVVCRPNFVSFSTLRIGGESVSYRLQRRALYGALGKMDFKPDVVYAHFWLSADLVSDYVRENHLPLFVASGESDIARLSDLSRFPKDLPNLVSGVVCVSTKNMDESVACGLTDKEKCRVIPNAVDVSLFHPMDRAQCRSELGFPPDVFIVSFVGAFCERKGSLRLSAALDRLADLPVYSIFVGSGNLAPSCGKTLFVGQLPHAEIPKYLNASDLFVLPTLKEGCCNAVVEALSCGLPVISSNLPFNWDILTNKNSIMVDPMDVDGLASAILEMRDPERRAWFAANSLSSVSDLTIDRRASLILDFIRSKM